MAVIRELFGNRRRPKTAIVLGGGGNLGAIQVGMLSALLERGVTPDLLVGCSVGALNGSALATDPTPAGAERLRELWAGLNGQDVFPSGRLSGPWMLMRKGESLCSNDGLRRILEEWLPHRRFEDAAVPVHIVTTSLRTQRDHWFFEGPIIEPLLASAALPAVFPPVWIDGEAYIDGGVVNNVPVSRAIELGAQKIYVLHPGNFERDRPSPDRPIDVLVQAFSIARSYRFREELDRIPDGVDVVTVPAPNPGPLRYNDFRRSDELIVRGHETAAAFLDTHAEVSG